MKRSYTKKELLSMSNEQIKEMTIGKYIGIIQTNGEKKEIKVESILLSSNAPHLFFGFIPTEGPSINMLIIEKII